MSDWYYAKNGKQHGPVTRETLADLVRNGMLDPTRDLVWTSTMKDWLPVGQVSQLAGESPSPLPQQIDPANPYSTPGSAWTEEAPSRQGEALDEITPGSDPISVTGCVKRGFELTVRNFGMILLVVIVFMALSWGASLLLSLIDQITGWGLTIRIPQGPDTTVEVPIGSWFNMAATHVFSVFLTLGITRVMLNIASGREFSVSMLFGEGRRLLPAVAAGILYGLMVIVGLLLLIVPGIYLGIRYGQYLHAMVDRELGVMESFRYSASITTNNRWSLFLAGLLCLAIVVAGIIACGIGLFFALPVAWLTGIVAYRWMQYGHRAALDHPGSDIPLLAPRRG